MSNDPQIAAAIIEIARTMQAATKVLESLSATPTIRASSVSPTRARKDRDKTANALSPRWSKLNSDWPQIGGRRFVGPPPDIFLNRDYLDKYRPGRWRSGYVASCDGLERLSAHYSVPIAKTSTCGDGALADRLCEIGAEAYGSVHLIDGLEVCDDDFRRWRTFRPPSDLTPLPNSPVVVHKECVGACMPEGMTDKEFDDRFDELVRLGSIGDWLVSDAGDVHCGKVRANPMLGRRYTRRMYDRASQSEQATEIVAFRKRMDFARLVAIMERVILEYLGLL